MATKRPKKVELTEAELKLARLNAKANVADLNACEHGLRLLLRTLVRGGKGGKSK